MADIGPNFWLTEWNWSPSILLGAAILVGLYLYAVGPLRRKHGLLVARGQVFTFLLDPDRHMIELKANYSQYPMKTTAAEAVKSMTRPPAKN